MTKLETNFPLEVEIAQVPGTTKRVLQIKAKDETDPSHQLMCSITLNNTTTELDILGVITLGLRTSKMSDRLEQNVSLGDFARTLAHLIALMNFEEKPLA